MTAETPMPPVRRGCLRCRVTADEIRSGYVVVSPSGIAHHSAHDKVGSERFTGETYCGIDATGVNWWWPL